MNSIGKQFIFTSFGESHGPAVGGIIDGCPAGLHINRNEIQEDLERRSGKHSPFSVGCSERAKNEADEVEFLSGIIDDTTLGTPIAFLIRNSNIRSIDYNALQDVFRPGHADFTYQKKYGIRDYRGGGRASARETIARVVAGSIAKQWLKGKGISIAASLVQIGDQTEQDCMLQLLDEVRKAGDSIGGVVECVIKGVNVGVGEPIFDKLQASLAYAMLSINAAKGFDYGSGFREVNKRGSELNDAMPYTTNHAGGILGGISNGQDIFFRVVFKPTPSISIPQQTIDQSGKITEISIHGRHDTCVAIRAVPVVEAMGALTIADFLV